MSLLVTRGFAAGYGAADVIRDVDIEIDPGEIVVILGANGAGKTTTIRAISGTIPRTGLIEFEGASIGRTRPDQIVRLGIAQVPQGRGTVVDLTVEENLKAGAYTRKNSGLEGEIDYWYSVFPRLGERRTQKAGLLSGGEQQMLAVARALMSKPKLLLCDEPSLGLAPLITERLFETLRELSVELEMAVLLVEQNAARALEIASRGYVLEAGRVVAQGSPSELQNDKKIQSAYLGH